MKTKININTNLCTQCNRCVRVCPSKIFSQQKTDHPIEITNSESCIVCGHCVAACPSKAVIHSNFPTEKVHPINYTHIPTPEQMMLLCKSRRSNRAFSTQAISKAHLDMILEAAHSAPTAGNMQQVRFTLVTDPAILKQIGNYTIEIMNSMMKKINSPLMKLFMPGMKKFIPIFKRLKEEHYRGNDQILRNATALIFIHSPKSDRFGCADANLAFQNGSLMAESLGVSQFYTGFVLTAFQQDKKKKLAKLLGIKEKVHAGMALGMPDFRFINYIDKKTIEVNRL